MLYLYEKIVKSQGYLSSNQVSNQKVIKEKPAVKRRAKYFMDEPCQSIGRVNQFIFR